MRRLVAILLALAPLCASGQALRAGGQSHVFGGSMFGLPVGGPPSGLALWLPFDRSGVTMLDDANTVCHFVFDGSQLQVITGCSPGMTMNGTVPQNFPSPFFPNGWASPSRKGAGPYTDGINYTSGSGVDWGDFAGDFSMCIVFSTPTNMASLPNLIVDGVSPTSGYTIGLSSTGALLLFSFSAGSSVNTVNTTVDGGVNVACAGRAGANLVAKMNLGAYATIARSIVQDSTSVLRVGRYSTTGRPFAGGIYELWASTTTPTDALFTTIMRRYYGVTGSKGEEPISTTRTTTATMTTPDSRVWTVPTVVPRVGCDFGSTTKCGLFTEISRGNGLVRSTAIDPATYPAIWVPYAAGAAAAPTVTFGTADTLAPDGTQTATKIVQPTTGAGDASGLYQPFAGNASGWTGSIWARTLSGTCNVYLYFFQASTSYLSTINAVGPTWSRIANLNKTITNVSWNFGMGVDTTAPSTMTGQTGCTYYVWGAQAEASSTYPSSTMITTNTTFTRGSDGVTYSNPLADPSQFCLQETVTPLPFVAWNGNSLIFGPLGAANSAALGAAANGATGLWDEYDSTATRRLRSCNPLTGVTLSDNTTHTMQGINNGASTPVLTIDGIAQTTCTGATQAVFSAQPATFVAGTGSFFLKDLKLFRKSTCQ